MGGSDHGSLIDAGAVAEKFEAGAQRVGVGLVGDVGLKKNVEHLLAGEDAGHTGNDALAGEVERSLLELGVGGEGLGLDFGIFLQLDDLARENHRA